MQFKTEKFRRLPSDFPDELKYMATSPFILIKHSGEITYANNGKCEIVAQYDEEAGDVLLFSWSGQWRTDVFLIKNSDLKKFYVNEKYEKSRIEEEEMKKKQKEQRKLDRKKASKP